MIDIPGESADLTLLRDSFELFSDEHTPALLFTISVNAWLREHFDGKVAKRLSSLQSSWETRPVTKSLQENIPDTPGIYMFIWRPGFTLKLATGTSEQKFQWVLYLGITESSLKARYKNEYKKVLFKKEKTSRALWDSRQAETRREKLERFLSLRPLEYWYLPCSDTVLLKTLESHLIELLAPPLNAQKQARLKIGKTGKAF